MRRRALLKRTRWRRWRRRQVLQHPGIQPALAEFFKKEEFDRVIELGTHKGFFTNWVAMWVPAVHTFDHLDVLEVELSPNIHFYKLDIFEDSLAPTIGDLLQLEGRQLVMCDNGNKPREAAAVAPYLQGDDVLMVHDYGLCPTWKYTEFEAKDIPGNIEPHPRWHQHMMEVAWFAGRVKGGQ